MGASLVLLRATTSTRSLFLPISFRAKPLCVANRDTSLRELAEAHGIASKYRDGLKRERQAPAETLLALLEAVGAPGDPVRDPAASLQLTQETVREKLIEPVLIAWDGKLTHIELGPSAGEDVTLTVELETDETLEPKLERTKTGVKLSLTIPFGRHQATLRAGGREASVWIIAAPRHCPRVQGRHWGLFAPTYALWSARSLGVGDLGDLQRLARWLVERNGSILATLPLCAAFLDEPLEISPYAPVSRMHWNELYLDLQDLPELDTCAQAKEQLASSSVRNKFAKLTAMEHVDHRAVMSVKRSVLEKLADQQLATDSQWQSFAANHADVVQYAEFRAAQEHGHSPGVQMTEASFRSARYHAFVQVAFQRQLRKLSEVLSNGPGLYLDVPVGVHRLGFDAWKYPQDFVPRVSAGAPPDALFTGGQNWGFAPAHAEHARATGYDYLYTYLHALASYAGVLRIDHVMGLHRIFAIPDGADGKDGTYLRYRAEEQWAVLCLVAHRCGCVVVGEDLGTVPSAVRKAMDEHETLRMFVGLYSFSDRKKAALKTPKENQVASLGTHDTPTLEGFLQGRDIDDRHNMGLTNAAQRKSEHLERTQLSDALRKRFGKDTQQIHRGLLKLLAESEAPIVLAALEDLWSEPQPQNVPGTGADWPNWKRRMSRSLEQALRTDHLKRLAELFNP